MSKKKRNNPIVAEEPARPEEQIWFDETPTLAPREQTTKVGASSANALRTNRRRGSSVTSSRTSSSSRSSRRGSLSREPRRRELKPEVVSQMLENPTIEVSEDQLRQEYGYVVNDLRSMALVAVALVIALVVMAQLLPKL